MEPRQGRYSRNCHACSIAAFALALAGCLPPTRNSPFRLPDGQRSGLTSAGTAERSRLNPSPVPTSLPVYHPIRCDYQERAASHDGTPLSDTTIVIEPVVPDKLFVRKIGGSGEGTMLMDNTGKELDRNMLDFDKTQRMTPEQASAVTEKLKTSPSAHLTNRHLLAEFIEIPHFVVTTARPGDRVADATDEKGDVWGTYFYRGIVQLSGARGQLYDIVHSVLGAPTVRGFIVMDAGRALPLMTHFSFGGDRSRELYLKRCVSQ
jgi:hypothetical protein